MPQLTKTGVAVEKLHFPQNNRNLGDSKWPGKPRKLFVGLPDAILFSRILSEGVFHQPQAFTLKTSSEMCAAKGVWCLCRHFFQFRTLYEYKAMQKRLAVTKPNCAVLIPIRQMSALFAPATIQPCHNFLPTNNVEITVNTQEM